ncbi:GPW/gp25 family protein [Spartinivicinus poritis]|uniref:GPW/gp25 family protein n=1 Tax=Spartinivicinus poritis TaxID=2994640 RepID=A0ABT5UHV9_9GAMM|nr:GPW/gp25 family protein [Spartinivicinus sp. A2-2]MDE1465028.1 GPW/gp25 family protein [Spartinivicinus sp. A2-2]
MANNVFVGLGWCFPPRFFSPASGPEMSAGEEHMNNSLHILLSTRVSERMMHPTFGSRIKQYQFDLLDTLTIASIREDIIKTISQFEPRIKLISVEVEEVDRDNDNGFILIKVDYELIESNETGNFVFPFYLNST